MGIKSTGASAAGVLRKQVASWDGAVGGQFNGIHYTYCFPSRAQF